jgi:hypothetical protein
MARAHDHLARIEPHANLHRRAARALDLVRVDIDPTLHPQRGVAGADRVVLMPDGRPEEGHDAVAHHLVDGALVAVDRLHHPLEHRVQELPRLLGITVDQKFHRALEIGEQHGDLLPLAFEGALRGQDLVGEVRRGVGLLGSELCPFGPVAGGRRPAFQAELGADREWHPALGAVDREPGATLQTELRMGRVLVLTPGTPHDAPIPSAWRESASPCPRRSATVRTS